MESGRSPSKTCRSSSHIFRFATCPANAAGQNAKENFVIRRFRMVIGSKAQRVTFLIEERKPPYPRPPSKAFYPDSACVKQTMQSSVSTSISIIFSMASCGLTYTRCSFKKLTQFYASTPHHTPTLIFGLPSNVTDCLPSPPALYTTNMG